MSQTTSSGEVDTVAIDCSAAQHLNDYHKINKL